MGEWENWRAMSWCDSEEEEEKEWVGEQHSGERESERACDDDERKLQIERRTSERKNNFYFLYQKRVYCEIYKELIISVKFDKIN